MRTLKFFLRNKVKIERFKYDVIYIYISIIGEKTA